MFVFKQCLAHANSAATYFTSLIFSNLVDMIYIYVNDRLVVGQAALANPGI